MRSHDTLRDVHLEDVAPSSGDKQRELRRGLLGGGVGPLLKTHDLGLEIAGGGLLVGTWRDVLPQVDHLPHSYEGLVPGLDESVLPTFQEEEEEYEDEEDTV